MKNIFLLGLLVVLTVTSVYADDIEKPKEEIEGRFGKFLNLFAKLGEVAEATEAKVDDMEKYVEEYSGTSEAFLIQTIREKDLELAELKKELKIKLKSTEKDANDTTKDLKNDLGQEMKDLLAEIKRLEGHIATVEGERDKLLTEVQELTEKTSGDLTVVDVDIDLFPAKNLFWFSGGPSVGSLSDNNEEDSPSEYFAEIGIKVAEIKKTSGNFFVGKDASSIFAGIEITHFRNNFILAGGSLFCQNAEGDVVAFPTLRIACLVGRLYMHSRIVAVNPDEAIYYVGGGFSF